METWKNSAKTTHHQKSTRDRIMTAALGEFAQHGKDGARIDRIAKSAGVNKAMIYYHFDSKDILYLEVVRSFCQSVARRAEETVLSTDTLENALAGLVKLHSDMFRNSPGFKSLILRELADPGPETVDAIAEVVRSAGIPQKIAALLQRGMSEGKYRQLDLHQSLVAFVSMSLFYHIMAPFVDRLAGIENRRKFMAERPEAIVDIFLNGLKAR